MTGAAELEIRLIDDNPDAQAAMNRDWNGNDNQPDTGFRRDAVNPDANRASEQSEAAATERPETADPTSGHARPDSIFDTEELTKRLDALIELQRQALVATSDVVDRVVSDPNEPIRTTESAHRRQSEIINGKPSDEPQTGSRKKEQHHESDEHARELKHAINELAKKIGLGWVSESMARVSEYRKPIQAIVEHAPPWIRGLLERMSGPKQEAEQKPKESSKTESNRRWLSPDEVTGTTTKEKDRPSATQTAQRPLVERKPTFVARTAKRVKNRIAAAGKSVRQRAQPWLDRARKIAGVARDKSIAAAKSMYPDLVVRSISLRARHMARQVKERSQPTVDRVIDTAKKAVDSVRTRRRELVQSLSRSRFGQKVTSIARSARSKASSKLRSAITRAGKTRIGKSAIKAAGKARELGTTALRSVGLAGARTAATTVATTATTSGATAGAAGAAAGTAGAGAGVAAGGLATAAVVAVPIAGVVALGAAAFATAKALDDAAKQLDELSPALARVRAQTERNTQLNMLERARRLGPDLARIEAARGRLGDAQERLWTEILALLVKAAPAIEMIADTATAGVTGIEVIIAGINSAVAQFTADKQDDIDTAKNLADAQARLVTALENIAKANDSQGNDPFFDEILNSRLDLSGMNLQVPAVGGGP